MALLEGNNTTSDSLQLMKTTLETLKEIKQSASELIGCRQLLQQINSNTKAADDEVWHKSRAEFDGQKVTVAIRVNIISIGEVDNVNQEFKSDLYVMCRYKEPVLKGKTREEVDWEEQWDPRIVFGNAVSIDKFRKKHRLDYEDGDEIPTVNLSFRLTGIFKEKLELERFPFDYQELTILIESDWPTDDIELIKDMTIKDSIRLDTFTGSQQWVLCQHVISEPIVNEREAASSHRVYPRYNVKTNVIRRPGYYLWNVALITALIMFLTFASLAVPATDVADRLSVTLTLLLTSVAFKFVVSQSLPCISYLTLLDTYVIICMVVQVTMAVQNAVASLFVDPATAKLFDIICAGVLGTFVFLVHLVMAIVVAVWIRQRNTYLHAATKSYFVMCEKINKEYWDKMKKREGLETDKSHETNVDETPSKKKKRHKKHPAKNQTEDFSAMELGTGDALMLENQGTKVLVESSTSN